MYKLLCILLQHSVLILDCFASLDKRQVSDQEAKLFTDLYSILNAGLSIVSGNICQSTRTAHRKIGFVLNACRITRVCWRALRQLIL